MKWCSVVFVSRSEAEIDISRTHLYFLYVCLGEEATAATEAETDYEVFRFFSFFGDGCGRRRKKKITSAAADVQMGD